MKPADLAKVWDAPDNTKLTPKQISLRLPILVSAKISALCEMYPRKTKTEIIGDLLSTALDQFEECLESKKGECFTQHSNWDSSSHGTLESIFEDVGSRGRFWRFTEKYLRELEIEAGISEPMEIPSSFIHETEDLEENPG